MEWIGNRAAQAAAGAIPVESLLDRLAEILELKATDASSRAVARSVAALKAYAAITLLVLSAKKPQDVIVTLKQRCLDAGADDELAKRSIETQARLLLSLAGVSPDTPGDKEVESCPALSPFTNIDTAKKVYSYLRRSALHNTSPEISQLLEEDIEALANIVFQENAGTPKQSSTSTELFIQAIIDVSQKHLVSDEFRPRLQKVLEAAQPTARRIAYRIAIGVILLVLLMIAILVRYWKPLVAYMRS
jgi:hypothetical protein